MIGVGRPWVPATIKKRANNAYPRVIGNLGMLNMDNPDAKIPLNILRFMYHYATNLVEKKLIIDWLLSTEILTMPSSDIKGNIIEDDFAFIKNDALKPQYSQWTKMMTDQVTVGYANTLGWAHANTGDTMVTVMIGGLRTVMNGDFEVFTGDLIQWYWPFERDCFLANGERKAIGALWEAGPTSPRPPNVDPSYNPNGPAVREVTLDRASQQREQQFQKSYGMPAGQPTKLVPRIKPYVRDPQKPRIFDAYRVFAVALSPARPHEPVDIKISRQSV